MQAVGKIPLNAPLHDCHLPNGTQRRKTPSPPATMSPPTPNLGLPTTQRDIAAGNTESARHHVPPTPNLVLPITEWDIAARNTE